MTNFHINFANTVIVGVSPHDVKIICPSYPKNFKIGTRIDEGGGLAVDCPGVLMDQ